MKVTNDERDKEFTSINAHFNKKCFCVRVQFREGFVTCGIGSDHVNNSVIVETYAFNLLRREWIILFINN